MAELRPLQIDTFGFDAYEDTNDGEQDDEDGDDDEYEEGDDDEDGDSVTGSGFAEVPNDLQTCRALNQAYQDIIKEAVTQLTVMLENNRQLQRELPKQLAERVNRPTMPKYRKNWHHGLVFHYPYFRDINGIRAPPNEDEVAKRRNREQDPYLECLVRWTTEEVRLLVNGVRNNLLQQLVGPLMDKKEALAQRLLTSEKVDKAELTRQIRAIDAEIEQAQAFDLRELMSRSTRSVDWLRISAVDMDGTRSAFSCEMNWKHLHDDALNRGAWTSSEDDRLFKLAAKWNERNWEDVAKELRSGRSAFQCARRYWGHLVNRYQSGFFTHQEDEKLKNLVELCSGGDSAIPWAQVSYFMENRSMKQLVNRFERSIAPSRRLGKWTPEEDIMLLAAVHLRKNDWKKASCQCTNHHLQVAEMLPGRNTIQCKERYRVRYEQHKVFGNYTQEEDRRLLEAVEKHGKNWSKVSKELQTRSKNSAMLRHRRLESILGLENPAPSDLAKLAPAEPAKSPKFRRRTGLDRRKQLINTICQRVASQRQRNIVSSLAMGNVEKEQCLKLYEQLLKKYQSHSQYSAKKRAHALNHAIASYAQCPRKVRGPPNLAVYENEEWTAVSNVLHDMHGFPRPEPTLHLKKPANVPGFESFFREKVLAVSADDNVGSDGGLMPFLPPTELTASALARLVDRFADGDLNNLVADDEEPPPCPELASALDAPDVSAVRCNSCKSMPRVQDDSCMQCCDLRQFRSQFETLQSRFLSYFFWPALLDSEKLTNIAPVYKTVKRPKKSYERKRPKRRTWVKKRWDEVRLQKAEEEAAAAASASGEGNTLESDSVAGNGMTEDATADDATADDATADDAMADDTVTSNTVADNDGDEVRVTPVTDRPVASAVVAGAPVITAAEAGEAGADEAAQGIGEADRQEDVDMTEEKD
ncbi:unnamed protein product [Ixodes hexagonus]